MIFSSIYGMITYIKKELLNQIFRAIPAVQEPRHHNIKKECLKGVIMKIRTIKPGSIIMSLLSWVSIGLAVYIDGSFIEEFMLLAISRVLP